MILYSFISHSSVIDKDYTKITSMINSNDIQYRIFYGGEKILENDRVIHLDCDDSYIGLSSKINSMCKYISSNLNVDFVVKVDRSIEINNLIDESHIKYDYAGHVIRLVYRDFHFGKTVKTSKWYNKVFDGPVINYCNGGFGYVLSKRSVDLIANDNTYDDYPYEDYYVGYVLRSHNILPHRLNMRYFFSDNKSYDDNKL